MGKHVYRLLLAIVGVVVVATSSNAFDKTTAFDAWRVISRIEYRESIPKGLLHSMSLVETGSGMNGHMLPWPYTVNVNRTSEKEFKGRSKAVKELDKLRRIGFKRFDIEIDNEKHKNQNAQKADKLLSSVAVGAVIKVRGRTFSKRFQGKQEGVKFVKRLVKGGHKNVDIGLMQVNWYYHNENFASIADAFDPYKNVDYAVSYLREHRKNRDWWGSVGRYHSGTKKFATRYVKHVWRMYQKVHKIDVTRV